MSDGVPAVLQILFADAMGTASGGSNNGLQDTNKNWTPGQWQDAAIDITIGDIRYRRRVTASGINSLTFEPLPAGVTVSVGDFYFLSNPLAIYKSVMQEVLRKAGAAIKYALNLTNHDTEYYQPLPDGTKQFSVHLRDMSEFRIAYEPGKVATPTEPYETVPAGSEKYVEGIDAASLTLYIAAPIGAKVAEIEAWR